jgi:hypothetical protein
MNRGKDKSKRSIVCVIKEPKTKTLLRHRESLEKYSKWNLKTEQTQQQKTSGLYFATSCTFKLEDKETFNNLYISLINTQHISILPNSLQKKSS